MRRPFRLLPLALVLVLAVCSGGVLATGDLFDDAYRDCPARTRLRDGQIADLAVARDAEEADEVSVSWAATDPATWGLGVNTYRTALVLLLDDGGEEPHVRSLALGKRKVVFDGVRKGTEATVQMAIVVNTADGDYLISDILEADFRQSLSPPSFRGHVRRGLPRDGWDDNPTCRQHGVGTRRCGEVRNNDAHFQMTPGLFYYIGYSEAFFNYKPVPGQPIAYHPTTPRLRVGVRHGGEDYAAREDVDFDAYLIRIVDGDGDVVPEGDDVPTVDGRDRGSPIVRVSDPDTSYAEQVMLMGSTRDDPVTALFSNVRVNDGGAIRTSIYTPGGTRPVTYTPRRGTPAGDSFELTRSPLFSVRQVAANVLHIRYADEYRDFPTDVLTSDETYTFSAWAVNGDDEVISPVGELTVHPIDRVLTFPSPGLLNYYANSPDVTSVVRTTFTVLLD